MNGKYAMLVAGDTIRQGDEAYAWVKGKREWKPVEGKFFSKVYNPTWMTQVRRPVVTPIVTLDELDLVAIVSGPYVAKGTV